MEQIDGRPEQILEIGLQPRFTEHFEQGIEDRRQRHLDDRLFRQGSRVGFVLEGAISEDLHLVDEAIGRGRCVVGLIAVIEGKGKVHDDLHPVAAAPLAA